MLQFAVIFVVAASLFFWIFSSAVVSGQGPGSLPTFSLSRHFSVFFKAADLYAARLLTICFWHLTGSACAMPTRLTSPNVAAIPRNWFGHRFVIVAPPFLRDECGQGGGPGSRHPYGRSFFTLVALRGRGYESVRAPGGQMAPRIFGRQAKCVAAKVSAGLGRGVPGAASKVKAILAEAEQLVAETGAMMYQPDVHLGRAGLARLAGDEGGRQREPCEAHRLFTAMGATARAEQVAIHLNSVSAME
jgi:hypothetical protein